VLKLNVSKLIRLKKQPYINKNDDKQLKCNKTVARKVICVEMTQVTWQKLAAPTPDVRMLTIFVGGVRTVLP
jgi:hypothetical protein